MSFVSRSGISSVFTKEINRSRKTKSRWAWGTVVTFTGSAFKIPKDATPILALKNYTISTPQMAWQFEEDTPTPSSEGFFQGAYMGYG